MFDAHATHPSVSVGGPLPPPLADKVRRVAVELQRNLPAMCEVEFFDGDPAVPVLDNPLLRPGAPLTIESSPSSENPTERTLGPVFDGEVVAVEANFSEGRGASVILRGYDKSHRMHRTRKTRTFLVPDAVVAADIAQEYGLIPKIDPAPPHPNPALPEQFYLCQANQTDWEFLCERARQIGFEISVSMGPGPAALVFRKAGTDPLAGLPQRLVRGENLLTFRPRVTSSDQPMMTKVHAHNAPLKTEVFGIAPPPIPENTPGDPSLLPHTVAALFGSTDDLETDTPFGLHPEAIGHAMARREHMAGVAFEAEGSCTGNPGLKPGGTALVENIGLRFSGTYTVSSVRHVFDEYEGFVTHFTISGRHDRSMLGLTQPGAATRAGESGGERKIYGAVTGIVDNNMDLLQLGRVKVKFPWLPDVVSSWAPVVSVGAGDDKGLQVIPEVGDQVLVVFEHGDITRPFVLGGLYSAQDLMPQPVGAVLGDGQTQIRMFKTRAGHMLTFNDMPGMESISLETNMGSKLVIDETPVPKIELTDKTGQNQIVIDGLTGSLSIKALKDITVEAGLALTLKATGTVNIEGAMINVSSKGPLAIGGKPVAIN